MQSSEGRHSSWGSFRFPPSSVGLPELLILSADSMLELRLAVLLGELHSRSSALGGGSLCTCLNDCSSVGLSDLKDPGEDFKKVIRTWNINQTHTMCLNPFDSARKQFYKRFLAKPFFLRKSNFLKTRLKLFEIFKGFSLSQLHKESK